MNEWAEGSAVTGGWERVGAFEGGSVNGLATAQAADGAWHIFAATPVGVFRSVDRGVTWSPLGGASRVAGAEVVAASPRYAEDGIVFAGGYDGLYRWREGGAGWEHRLRDANVLSIACSVNADDGESGGGALTVLAGTDEDGILMSQDGGQTWAGANAGLLVLGVSALALSPTFARDGTGFAATPSGLFRTRNGAESWREIELDWEEADLQSLAISPGFADDRLVLVGTVWHGVLRSDDAGRSWERPEDLQDRSVLTLTFSGRGQIAAGTDEGVAISTDDGQRWRLSEHDMANAWGACFVPDGAGEIVVAGSNRDAIVRSPDGGETWELSNAGLSASLVFSHCFSPAFDTDATIFANLGSGVSVSRDGGRTWTEQSDGLTGTQVMGLAVSPSFARDQTVFAVTGLNLDVSRDGAATWEPALPPGPDPSRPDSSPLGVATAAGASPESCIVAVPFSGGRLSLSEDGGRSWREGIAPWQDAISVRIAFSPDLPRDGTIYAVTWSPDHGQPSRGLTVWRTADRGRRWDRWLTLPDVAHGTATSIVALPENPFGDTVAVGLGDRVLRPRPGSWTVSGGARRPTRDETSLPVDDTAGRAPAITSLAASPAYARDRTLFASSSAGIYVSRDGGATFTPWSEGLEPAATVSVTPSPAYARDRLVYALGLGGTTWRRHDA